MARPIHLLDLVGREKLERILQVFTEVAGVAAIITYPDGHPITRPSNFTPFCLTYCRATAKGRAKCIKSDQYGGAQSARLQAPFTYQCLNGGLTDCAAPLIIEGHHLATVLCGQVLESPIADEKQAIERARSIGVKDVEGYLRELAKIPLMSRETLLNVVNLMAEITVTIGELALQKYMAQKRSQRYLSRLVNSVSDCIISISADNTVSMVNQAGAAMFGYPAGQIVGKPIDALLAVDRSRSAPHGAEARISIGSGRADLTALRADGSTFPVQVCFSAINDEREPGAGYVGVIRDVSEEKQLERMKEDLIGMITHDLRNPVLSLERAIRIISDGLCGSVSRDRRHVVDLALFTCRQLYGMVSDILDIYRNENGRFILQRSRVVIQHIVNEARGQMELLAGQKGMVLEVDIPKNPVELTIDEVRIRRTCVNLLDNAIKYGPEGSRIVIRIEERKGAPARPDECPVARNGLFNHGLKGDCVLVSVEDEGSGIPEAYHSSIFDKYFTVKTSGTTSREGTGLGLAFCRLAVEAHGGGIWVESPVKEKTKAGKSGCRFCFTLPVD